MAAPGADRSECKEHRIARIIFNIFHYFPNFPKTLFLILTNYLTQELNRFHVLYFRHMNALRKIYVYYPILLT